MPSLFRKTRTASPVLASNEGGFHGSERLPSTSAPLHPSNARLRLLWEPATDLPAWPPEPGFRRYFADSMLSHEPARPIDFVRGLFTHGRDGPRAACRLLQPNRSASTTGLRIVRTPRTVQMVAHLHSSSRGWLRLFQSARAFLSEALLLGAASREFTGQGPRLGCVSPHNLPRPLQSQSLTTGASPQPDRPGHLLSQARDVAGRRPLRRRETVVVRRFPCFPSMPDEAPLTRCPPPRAASSVVPRRTTRSAKPEVPSIAGHAPSRAEPVCSTVCPQPVE
jgi:hypothetical protein